MAEVSLRRGDVVEVRNPSEILETLDERGRVGELPFMPEMAAFCGKRFLVEARAERLCDTVNNTGSRRLQDAVYLAQLRCDGAAHGGCQAECRFFWKESWLRKVAPNDLPSSASDHHGLEALVERTARHARHSVEVEGHPQERWRCQATELPRATQYVGVWSPQAYIREVTCGNVGVGRFLRVTARAAVVEPMRKLGLVPEIHLPGTRMTSVVDPPLNLQPGELVQVKSKAEIAATLSPGGKHRGLWFDREMMPYCGGTYRVRQRITRIIDEHDGRMIALKNDCVTLDGVVCSGVRSTLRWFCAREIYSYWRECWLRRAEPASGK